MKPRLLTLFYVMALLMALGSCVPAKKVQREGLILDRNRIKTDDKDLNVEELEGFTRQKPNRKALGLIRLNTFFYERFKPKWIRESLGKKPVILNTSDVDNTMRDMKLYLAAKGYFHAGVDSLINRRQRSAIVTYQITAGQPYTLRNISYSIRDEQLAEFVLADKHNSLIKPGNNYDAYLFDSERHRVTQFLRNRGFYFFNRDLILYRVDSSLQSRQMDLVIEFQQPRGRDRETGLFAEKRHLRYRINDITVNTDYRVMIDEYLPYDTLVVPQNRSNPEGSRNYYFLYLDKLRLRPPTIDRFVLSKDGRYYRQDYSNVTHNRLSSLPITRFVNIYYEPVEEFPEEGLGLLDCYIDIGRNASQVVSVEAEGTNTGGFLGIGGNVGYSHRNLLRGGEVFSLRLRGGLEMQRTLGTQTESILGFFNTVETGVEARLVFPGLMLPGRQHKYTRHTVPYTSFVTGVNFQRRPDYTRYIINFSFGYEWRESLTKSHIFIPMEINSVRIFRSDEFSEWLAGLQDQRLVYQYTNHLVPLARYMYTYTNQHRRKGKNFIFFRGGLESSGNILNLKDNLFDSPLSEEGFYTLFGIRYAQFVRAETDFRFYREFSSRTTGVFRLAGGVGVPFGNSNVLPVEKGFYAGGANGIRGWEIRSLGPGSFYDPEHRYDKMGEIWIESNLEYRFPVYSFLHGAVFVDAGNIFMLSENLDFPGGKFEPDSFYEKIAVSAGLGVRVDLSFFIFRIDAGLKLMDPAKDPGDRWTSASDLKIRSVVWNFGIGYPF